MGNRTLAAAVLMAGGVTAAFFVHTIQTPAASLEATADVGAQLTHLLHSKGRFEVNEKSSELVMAWVFRTDDCLSCQGWSWAFRRIQQNHKGKVKLYAVHVGEDEAAVAGRLIAGSGDHRSIS